MLTPFHKYSTMIVTAIGIQTLTTLTSTDALSSIPAAKLRTRLTRLLAPLLTRLTLSILTVLTLTLAGCATPGGQNGTVAAPRPIDPAVAAEAAKQSELAVQQEAMEFSRLQAIFWPIALAAKPLCPTRFSGSIGPSPGTLIGMRESVRPILRRLLGMDERLTFTEIVDETPAHKAGMQAGDILTGIDGTVLPVSKDALKMYFERIHAAAIKGVPVSLQLERKGVALSLNVPVERVCASIVLPMAADTVSAFAAGRAVLVTRGMMRFANDRELAIVIAHEVAHIALGHTLKDKDEVAPTNSGAARGSTVLGMPSGNSTAPVAIPVEPSKQSQQIRELDSDVVGAYLVAAAGLPVTDAANFWRRMAANYPASIQTSHMRTHPASPERFIELERAVKDVEQRQANNQALIARLKSGKQTVALGKITPIGPWTVTMLNERYISPISSASGLALAPVAPRPNAPVQAYKVMAPVKTQ